MKNKYNILAFLALFSLMLTGCSLTREPVKYREEFFRPVVTMPQRFNSIPSADALQLKNQLQQAAQAAAILRDSLASLQSFTGSLLSSTRSLIDKVSELETREFLTNTKQKDMEQSIAQLQYENKQLAQQLNEIRSRLVSGSSPVEPPVFSTAKALSTLHDEYTEGLTLFKQKRYGDAHDTFSGLIDKGIEDDLADNCEYWKGECHFAKSEFNLAINSFQKVLEIKSSNKIIDAYFMLGKSYEQVGDFVKARWAYEELNLLYPKNSHARTANARLRILKKEIPESPQRRLIDRSSI